MYMKQNTKQDAKHNLVWRHNFLLRKTYDILSELL